MSYRFLDHTADIRMKVTGQSLEGLFKDAILGLMHLAKQEIKNQEQKIERGITVKSRDKTSLLIDFMNEVLALAYTNREIYTDMRFKKLSETELEAEITGVAVQEFDEDIKAVTYHEADVKENKDGVLETMIVFDI